MKKLKISINKENVKKYTVASLYLLPLFVLLFIFYIYPIISIINKSFITFPSETKRTIYEYGITNYIKVFNDPNFKIALSNSTFLFFVPTLISLILSVIFAYLISSMIFIRTKNFFLKLIYSQFFISGFTVGLAFILLFGQENLFFKLFNSNKSFLYGDNRLSIKFYMLIFQLWRSIPFNIVVFSFIFSRVNEKYKKLMKVDNLKFWDKFKHLYYKEFRKSFILIIYTNIIFSFLMYPGTIITEERIQIVGAHTFASYILSLIKPFAGALTVDYNKAYAASLIVILYLLFLFLVSWLTIYLFKFSFKYIVIKLQREKGFNYV
ncbi:glycerol ABC transporter membrane protein [Mycoplasmopsis mustelae]|uniref:Glycerol ABC transporter membrane protein n=1 Tax=Mycoplasmopsis mustelae TaxID=171289 RepID=A0A4R7UFM2_9BACT|nr:sugar ABC transporter permease [Mycoplasmopsis mustelae]TDV24504.1 glycerol ABC transporter membrane protein [Mycoplasmopsis mustelae]